MKALFFRGGRPVLDETCGPGLAPGRVQVDVHYSAVSPGTEGQLLEQSGRSLVSLALEKRHRVDRLWRALRARDFDDIRRRVGRLAERRQAWLIPGYSAAGVVRAVGEGVTRFAPGDRVAVAGAGYALHADAVAVPVNLTVPVPRELPLAPAATVAIGAIALQAVRRAEARIGETVLVLGLGLIGQLTARILLAAGCRVLGWDPRADRRAQAAGELRAAAGETSAAASDGLPPAAAIEVLAVESIDAVAAATLAATGGRGADQVIVAAAGSATATEAGAGATRRAGRLVLLGDTPVRMPRAVAYERELEIRLSTSYGPGRYDPSYEEEGRDYPYAHVRWSENRNMCAWLALLAAGRVRLDAVTHTLRDFSAAAEAYLALRQGTLASLGLIFRHAAAQAAAEPTVWGPAPAAAPPAGAHSAPSADQSVPPAAPPTPASPARRVATPVRIALLGTGGYAASGILPALAPLTGQVRLELLAGSQPARREALARQHAFARTTSDYAAAATDPEIDLVVIATRHDRHADLIQRAWEAGLAVYCEKPLALTLEEVERLDALATRLAGADGVAPFLTLGFNRRYAPAVERLAVELLSRRGPLQIAYRVQAGPLPTAHWLRGPQGGGRLIGEGVHMIDLCRVLVGAPLTRATVMPGGAGPEASEPAADDFQLLLGYADGSTAAILYTARGAQAHPKERIECHFDGRTLEIDDFRTLLEAGRKEPHASWVRAEKGQAGLWRACLTALTAGGRPPTPWPEVLEASRAAITLEAARRQA